MDWESIRAKIFEVSKAVNNTANDEKTHTQNSHIVFGIGVAVGSVIGAYGVVIGVSVIAGEVLYHEYIRNEDNVKSGKTD
jgi:hypothetical protein